MTTAHDSFAVRVKQLRERLDLTQEALAESLGVSFATVNRWENGRTEPSKLAQRQIDQLCEKHKIKPINKPR